MALSQQNSTGVLLMTMGDPASRPEVLPFLLRLFRDPAIVRAPWFVRYPLSVYISLKKLASVREKYALIGGGSPMNEITERQARALEDRLRKSGDFRVYVANRYSSPSTKDAYRRAEKDGIRRLVALPLYPHFSPAITGSSFAALERLLMKDPDPPDVVWIRSISSDERFVRVFSDKVLGAVRELPGDERAEIRLLFSAHALPQEFIDQGDPYLDEIGKSLALIRARIAPFEARLCFQSKGRPGMEWMKPETDAVLKEIGSEGRQSVLIAPISFVSENIETLYDIDILYREMAARLGFGHFSRVKCLDDDPAFIEALSGIVQDSLS